MGSGGSNNSTTTWYTNLPTFNAGKFKSMSIDEKVGLLRSFYDFSAMTSLSDGYEYGATLFAHGGIQHVIQQGGEVTFSYLSVLQPLLTFHTHPQRDYNNTMFSGADVLSFANYSSKGAISILLSGDQMYVLEMKDQQKAREFAAKFYPADDDRFGTDFNAGFYKSIGNLEQKMLSMLIGSGINLYKKTTDGLQQLR